MNLTMQPTMSYPFYMNSPRLPFSVPWSPNPYQFPAQPYSSTYQTSPVLSPISYSLPFVLPHAPPPPPARPNPPSKQLHTSSSYTNTRYNHLKQSTSHISRQRFPDTASPSLRHAAPAYQHRPMKTKSVTDLHQLFHQHSPHLLKAHSWHAINHLQAGQLNTHYAFDPPFNRANPPPPPPPRPYHPHYHHQHHPPPPPPSQCSPKQKKKSHKKHRSPSPSTQTADHGLVRISTFDEMPIMTNPLYQDSTAADALKLQKLNDTLRKNFSKTSSPSSSNSSHSSLQKRLNGSLRNDPLLSAAMDDFRQLRHTPSQQTSASSRRRDLSRDSLCSSSTHHSSSTISRSRSQSSFTSMERLEIRRLIKTFKSKDLPPLRNAFVKPSLPPPPAAPVTRPPPPTSGPSALKHKRSSVTEELDRQFRKLRSNYPNDDLIYVKPSQLQKDKSFISSLPSLDELKLKAQTQLVDTCTFIETEEKPYENPLLPITVPQSSPVLNGKPEYAIPIKPHAEVNLRSGGKKDEHMRSFSFCKPMTDIVHESQQARPISMLNWLQCGLTNPPPTTFQPQKHLSAHEHPYEGSLVKENIYASEIDVHIPLSNDKDYLSHPSLVKDYLAECKSGTPHSSILNDFSRLFTRFGNHHKHEQKSKLKNKLPKNRPLHHQHNNIFF